VSSSSNYDNSEWANKPSNLKGTAKQAHDKAVNEEGRERLEGKPGAGVYYRKMSAAEYKDYAGSEGTKEFDFEKVFTRNNGNHYRFYVTTSLEKAKGFENKDVDKDTENVIVKFFFGPDFLGWCQKTGIKAGQEKGAQHDNDDILMTREGFPTTKLGAAVMSTDAHVQQVLTGKLAFDLGFSSKQKGDLKRQLITFEKVT